MPKGLDTTFLVEAEVTGHPGHAPAHALLQSMLEEGEPLALAPQVLAEFIHIVTDPRRFERPLDARQALARAEHWWHGAEVSQVMPSAQSTDLFLRWMAEHRLGRKRILDAQVAATYHCAGVHTLITTNARDYHVFGCFAIIEP